MDKEQRVGALVAGASFGLWALYLYAGLCSTCGSMVSFGVVLPGCILGFPWGLLWLGALAVLQSALGENSIPLPVILLGFVACVSLNGALIGGLFGNARAK
ncbi:hypothetical protein [Pseudothauera rhizosphaerae]|uniref:Uncharacterized protein n=1 Tax=Pseudothauera rhizosphaerae TaxID=2565932 RepID=A0A4S4AQE6_9RHOO|nr:hypothetical protein [Pseudothauera rhizosphaerae]THF61969.1 hypothetical protein E6O51_07335 [Pseudothauera rhizosphaerae]